MEIERASFQEALKLYEDYETSPAFESLQKITYKIKNHFYYKILSDGIIVGGINVYSKGDGHYYLNRIYIRPDYENTGIGQRAMVFIESCKEFSDALYWTLETPHRSYKNHHFYEKMGYVKTGDVEVISYKLKLIHYKKVLKEINNINR